jgi:hypothetical protein
MDALCPLVESSADTAHERLTLGAILRAFLPALRVFFSDLTREPLQYLIHSLFSFHL